MKIVNYTLIFINCFLIGNTQNTSAQLHRMELEPPLKIPMALSGTFGEIRSNHFHAGIDIKTQGRQGLEIGSVGKGYVNRIKISHGGYGKAIYITHPQGYVSVYAHLKKFSPKIEAFVKSKQYEKESYEIQLFPAKEMLPLDQGELIGYSGNTGGSMGPHLHFEMRDLNQSPLNPLAFQLPVDDTQRPQLQKLFLYAKNENGHFELHKQIRLDRVNDSVYRAGNVGISGAISLGLQMFDRQDLSYNKNGIYKAKVSMNGVKQIEYDFDKIRFQDSDDINLLVDYKTLKTQRIKIQRLFRHEKSEKSIFNGDSERNGLMQIALDKSYQIMIEVSDFSGNTSYVEFYIQGKPFKISNENPNAKKLSTHLDYFFDFKNKSVYIPKNTFAESVFLDIHENNDTLEVGTDQYPLFKSLDISFDQNFENPENRRQSFIGKVLSNNKIAFLTTKKEGNTLKAKTRQLGRFTVSKDTLAPTVKPKNFKEGQWLSNFRYLEIKIDDDLSGIQHYRGTINNRWVLFEYEYKTKTLTFDFNDLDFNTSRQELKLEVEDRVGNTTEFYTHFYRKIESK